MTDINIVALSQTLCEDTAEIVAGGLCDLGYVCTIQMFRVNQRCLNIVMPAVFFPADNLTSMPSSTIFYNTEDLEHQMTPRQLAMLEILKRGFPVWDFSRQNLPWYEAMGFASAFHHVPLGYTSAVDHVVRRPWEERTIDVMFYGRLTTHRLETLDRLAAEGLSVGIFVNLYEAARNDMISRAKLILNVPTRAPRGEHERPRLAFCASNGKLCVSEAPSYPVPRLWVDAAEFVSADELVATCRAFATDRERLLQREARAYDAMRAMPIAPALKDALARSCPALPQAGTA